MESTTPFPQHFLVTGATGFFGRALVAQLLARGRKVTALVRDMEKAHALPQLKGADFLLCALDDPATFPALPPESFLLHCAWKGVRFINDTYNTEVQLGQQLRFLRYAVEQGVRDMAVTGTLSEYGTQTGQMKPTTPVQPNTPYALAKATIHEGLRLMQRETPFNLIWARLFFMYGEGQDPGCLMQQFEAALARGDEAFNMSPGDQLMDFTEVNAAAHQFLGLLPHRNGVFNVCSGQPVALKDLLTRHMEAKGQHIRLNLGHYPYRKTDSMAMWGEVPPVLPF